MGTQEMIYAAIASVIAGMVLFTMQHVQLRGQEAAIDATQYRAAKTRMLDFAEVMQRDFSNVGAHMYQNGAGGFTGDAMDPQNAIPVQTSWMGTPGYFEFMSQQDSAAAPVMVRYEWAPINGETVTLNDGVTVRQLHRVRRLVGGTLTTQNDLVTSFNIALLTETSTVPILTNPDVARVIDVAVTAVSPLGKGDYIEETIFEASYRPVAMTIGDETNTN